MPEKAMTSAPSTPERTGRSNTATETIREYGAAGGPKRGALDPGRLLRRIGPVRVASQRHRGRERRRAAPRPARRGAAPRRRHRDLRQAPPLTAARWIVDGMNVIGSRPNAWWRDRPGAMRDLVDE